MTWEAGIVLYWFFWRVNIFALSYRDGEGNNDIEELQSLEHSLLIEEAEGNITILEFQGATRPLF